MSEERSSERWLAVEFDPDWPWGHTLFHDGDADPIVVRRVMGFEKELLIGITQTGVTFSLERDGRLTGQAPAKRATNNSPPIVQTVEQDVEITFDGGNAVFRAEAHLFADGRIVPGGFYLKEPKND